MSRFINPYTDFGFKRLFGEEASKSLLIDFLNAVLPEKHRVKTLEFRNTEQLGVIALDRRASFDISCEAENGERFIVEMQKSRHQWFKDRALFYAAFPIREQAHQEIMEHKVWNFELKAVYLIAILDFEYDQEDEHRKLQRNVTLKDQDDDLFYDKLELIFVQLPIFDKPESELKTQQDKWYYFLKNLSGFEEIPSILREPVFERAFATAEIARMSKLEQQTYEAHLKAYRDNYAVMETKLNEGIKIGKAEGEIQKALEIARNLKQAGFDISTIAKMTGLSQEEMRRLE